VLHTDLPSLDALGAFLVGTVQTLTDDAVLPGVAAGFPYPRRSQSGPDPMRPPRDRYRDLAADAERRFGGDAQRWLEVIATDLAVDNEGKAALTPWMAPSGKQAVSTFFAKPLELIRKNTALLTECTTYWQRIEGYTGEYLDYRAVNDAAATAEGESTELGAPGPTWLAAMALPLLRVSGSGTEVGGALWHTVLVDDGRRRPRRFVIWPLWEPALDAHAVQALLEHSALRPRQERIPEVDDELRVLGVFRVCAAMRQPLQGRKSAGVLAPVNRR
jgi:CRISPR-associated endonuclease/helicase Cas3